MIPNFNHPHVFPPYTGDGPTESCEVSPDNVSMLEVIERFASLPWGRVG